MATLSDHAALSAQLKAYDQRASGGRNDLLLLQDGAEFSAIVRRIDAAQHSIYLETYILPPTKPGA
jgi:phosphatidylserine/phosphatidylglycerophosphate/cardiolipin synthase-like enzyme